ncbi:hypothetical protein KIPE111705_26860 [Kibdelosporangium persicum]|uniref:Phosphodiesterase n=1 Tax=Kibdelosporangium persicum TaxID=2698649 RepID=A0ABX2F2M9_9PSEU|nr:hypothetical protein [Kibdelosporangium persicum]NRN65562.1 Phosphodiesterase [Kibdelosporangium persicum]
MRQSLAVRGSDWVTGLFAGMARLRRAPAFHPAGAVFAGELTLPDGWPGMPGAVVRQVTVRLSKGVGLPGDWPDVRGLAIRIPDAAGQGRPVDLLLSTTGSGRLTRWLPVFRRGWTRGCVYGSVMPFRTDHGLVSMAAIPDPTPGRLPESVHLMLAKPLGRWRAWGRLVLTEHLPDAQIRFDPIVNVHPNLVPVPRALAQLRRLAYAGSRRGNPTGDREIRAP